MSRIIIERFAYTPTETEGRMRLAGGQSAILLAMQVIGKTR